VRIFAELNVWLRKTRQTVLRLGRLIREAFGEAMTRRLNLNKDFFDTPA
jgi:hypothetical protein